MCIEPLVERTTLPLCQVGLERLIREFDSTPSRSAFYDIGAVSEVLILSNGIPAAEPMLQLLREASAQWLQSGLFEDLLIARAEFAYHIVLLCYLAQDAPSWRPADMEVIRDLYNGGMIARSEMPMLRQRLITAYFAQCGLLTRSIQPENGDLARSIERRVLRARSDEFDLQVLLMCAQLLQLNSDEVQDLPRTYPQVLLVQAMRSENRNWVPVLTLMCSRFFGVGDALNRAALQSMRDFIPSPGQLLPTPPPSHLDSEYISRTERGLRLRSTIALGLTIDSIGALYDSPHLRAAVA
jgi:hypothetical protein